MAFNFENHSFLKLGELPLDELNWLEDVLVTEERAMLAYKSVRDTAVFTNKRVILRNVQGVTGSKIEQTTIPYGSIVSYATGTAGNLEITATLTLFVREAGAFRLEFIRDVNVKLLDALLSRALLLG